MTDTETGNKPAKKRGRWWRWPLRALLVLLLAFAVFRFVVYQRVQNRLNAIRAAGHPVTLAELDAWYAYPDGPNAAEVYQRAFEAFVGDKKFEQTLPLHDSLVQMPKPGEPIPEDLLARMNHFVQQNAEAVSLLEEGARIESCRYLVNYGDELFPQTLHMGLQRYGGRLLTYKVITDMETGRQDRAVKSCLTTLSMARSFDREPMLIATLVGISVRAQAYDQMKYVLHSGGMSDEQLKALYDAVSEASCRDSMGRAMAGERSLGTSIFGDANRFMNEEQKTGPKIAIGFWRLSGLMDLDQAHYIDTMNHYTSVVEASVWPLPPRRDDPPSLYMISNLMIPALEATCGTLVKAEMQRVNMMTAIAAERYRQAEGRWPTSLEYLVPAYLDEVPVDLYANKPLGYRVEGDAVVIYSVDEDGTDQGGRPYDAYGVEAYEVDVDMPIVLGATVETVFPVEEPEPLEQDEEDPMLGGYGGYGMGGYGGYSYEDTRIMERLNEYLEQIENNGFPELSPRPLEGWPFDEPGLDDGMDYGWDFGAGGYGYDPIPEGEEEIEQEGDAEGVN